MNSNAWMFLAIISALCICPCFSILAFFARHAIPTKVSVSIVLCLLLFAVCGSLTIAWQMSQHLSFTAKPTALPEQSSVMIQTRNKTVSCTSLSGKDGSVQWTKTDQLPCTSSYVNVVANGILYQQGVVANQQEISTQATRLSDKKQLWSTYIKRSDLGINVITFSPTDQLLFVNDKLYFQISDVVFLMDSKNGKVLHTIQPAISGDPEAALAHLTVNDQALVMLYLVSGSAGPAQNFTPLRFVVLQPNTGKLLWRSAPGAYSDLIALHGSTLYAYTDINQNVVSLNVLTEVKLWQTHFSKGIWIIAGTVTSNSLYLRAGGNDSSAAIIAFDIQHGQIRWAVPIDPQGGIDGGLAPSVVNNVVYIDDTNTLSAYQATTGQRLWQYNDDPLKNDAIHFDPYNAVYFSRPVFVNNILFVKSTFTQRPRQLKILPTFCLGQCKPPQTDILALSATTGQLYWHDELPTDAQAAIWTASP